MMAKPGSSGDRDTHLDELKKAINVSKDSGCVYEDTVFAECDGHCSRTFRNAGFELQNRIQTSVIYSEKLYSPGLKYLEEAKGQEYDRLEAFFKDADCHSTAIAKILCEEPNASETEITVVYAVHLFQKLASKVVVSKNMEGLPAMRNKCPCGCGASFNTGNTGIATPQQNKAEVWRFGAYSVWHGYSDIFVEVNDESITVPVNVTSTLTTEDQQEAVEDQDDAPPENKSPCLEDMYSVPVEVKAGEIKCDEVARQMVSQTITNTFAQVNATRSLNNKFVPSICCSAEGFLIFAYNELHDIFVCTKSEVSLLDPSKKEKFNFPAIVQLWLALNVNFTGCDVTKYAEKFAKCRFQEMLKPFKEQEKSYKKAGYKLQSFPEYKPLNFFKTGQFHIVV